MRRTLTAVFLAPLTALAWATAALAYTPETGDRIQGSADAPVTVVEYSSLTCTHCSAFANETFPKVKAAYIDTGKVRWVDRDFPLDKYAFRGAIMVRCAPEDRRTALAEVILKQLSTWARSGDPEKSLAQIGQLAGLGRDKITACWADTALQEAVANTRIQGEARFKIDGTPTFLFNDDAKRLTGEQSFEEFSKVVDELLAAKK